MILYSNLNTQHKEEIAEMLVEAEMPKPTDKEFNNCVAYIKNGKVLAAASWAKVEGPVAKTLWMVTDQVHLQKGYGNKVVLARYNKMYFQGAKYIYTLTTKQFVVDWLVSTYECKLSNTFPKGVYPGDLDYQQRVEFNTITFFEKHPAQDL